MRDKAVIQRGLPGAAFLETLSIKCPPPCDLDYSDERKSTDTVTDKITSTSPFKCEQLLNSFKRACSHPCLQGGHRGKGLKCKCPFSAHSLSRVFKGFYGVCGFLSSGGNPLHF